ncbi:phosphoenolpyruvate--protein phosphotransferase [Streptomyces arenae]|uniref:phosphoenolpyruvate--protein phosphotransferase n=1 Tax=Streptomyces arenae TaxID=29301 RepID=UPI00265923F7|nr:phosphoenolpyruvate--protein phosphotransferase [Streptomyces arenae]MCG7205110.1 phosphoenolpyruvate--protein phosphotransferase [Streptomyces arenae]
MEQHLHGVGVSQGMAIGPVRHMGTAVLEPPAVRIPAEAVQAERARAERAARTVAADLDERGHRAGGEAQAVLEAQALIATDPELLADSARRITDGNSAARAVYDAFDGYRTLLAQAGDYLAGRITDLDDVRDRIVARLLDVPMPGVPDSDEPYVLFARDLAPADTALLDPALVLGFVTEEGGPTSHSAILARAMGVPAVVALRGATKTPEGVTVALDGRTGEVVIAPAADTREQLQALARQRDAALAATDGPGRTSDGHRVLLLANIGGPADVPAARAAGAEGVGLFRTEFLFLDDSERAPSQARQTEVYRSVMEAFPEQRVVVRVLDAGADKPLGFLTPADEPNPALGVRGLRTLLEHPGVLATQLRALRKAAEGLPVRLEVMAPMIADRHDAAAFTQACREAGLETAAGAMVEIPSAALRAAAILDEADFLSLGTNDLAQYTFAADRQTGALARYQDPWQPALLDLIAAAARAAGEAGKSCGVCGEAAADPDLACVLVGLGVTSLSMGPTALPYVRARLRQVTVDGCRQAARAALAAEDPQEARATARRTLDG